MIFVTVGTAHFDPLIIEMDRLVGNGTITEPVIAQIGRGSYIPKHIRYFRFIRSLEAAYKKADIIVSTGGAGTTMECVKRGLRLVVVENKSLMEGHQAQLIGEMARRGHLIWCKEVSSIATCIEEARTHTFTPFVSDPPRIHEMIIDLINDTP
ncbi:MAG: PssE/Cps14G family polysaccharide biosynthesis glycosyltransferase [Candidatus Thorarchaeota archaeon]